NAVAVVTGPMTPRRNNLETAVVAAALGAEHLGTRIFYTENIFSVDGALSYLQTVIGDQELSQNVFNDPQRMWEDLFAPVSRELVGRDFYSVLGGESAVHPVRTVGGVPDRYLLNKFQPIS